MQNLVKSLNKNINENINILSPTRSPKWDWYLIAGSLGILAIATFLHFWQLGKIPYPIFDEFLFGQYAKEYLEGHPTWEGHPPLGKYFIMLGMLIFGQNEIGFRFVDASFGSILPLLVIGLVYQLTAKRNFALLAGLFTLSDGLFLVESRSALLNIFLVSFGLVSQIFLVSGLSHQGKFRTLLLCLAGMMLGASASVKWNGLGFSLLVFLVMVLVVAIAKFFPQQLSKLGVLTEITKLHWWEYPLCFAIMPIAFYLIQWIPLFLLNSGVASVPSSANIWQSISVFPHFLLAIHKHILWWHSTDIVTSTDPAHPAHPYCSSAISWAVLARPVGYYFQSQNAHFKVIQGLGNPLLWWLSTLAIVGITISSLVPKWRKLMNISSNNYLLLGYFANYVPWLIVKRCLFLYHYMSAAIFSFIALAWVVAQLIEQKGKIRYLGYGIIATVMISQIFFLPIWLGIPITPKDFYQRIWFMPDSWSGFNWI